MRRFFSGLAFSLALTAGVPTTAAQAQEAVEEIVVTGSRISRDYEDEATPVVPAVTVPRRADNLIVVVQVVNDTRDANQRREELIQTLRSVSRASESRPDIALSIQEDGQLLPFTEGMISTLTLGVDSNRVDTSTATLIVKTPIRADDTLDSASGRIEQFVAKVDKSGRSLVSIVGDWQLSIVNPAQYRQAILTAIAADATRTSTTFGEGYAVQVGGMSNTLKWVQSGPLDLSLFIPYDMTVTPAD